MEMELAAQNEKKQPPQPQPQPQPLEIPTPEFDYNVNPNPNSSPRPPQLKPKVLSVKTAPAPPAKSPSTVPRPTAPAPPVKSEADVTMDSSMPVDLSIATPINAPITTTTTTTTIANYTPGNEKFFRPKENITQREFQSFVLDHTYHFLQTKSVYAEAVKTRNEFMILSKAAYQVHKKMSENTAPYVMPDFNGNPTRYFDAALLRKGVESLASDTCRLIVSSHLTPEKMPLSFQVAEDQGPRPKMEDKWIAFPCAHELIGHKDSTISIFGVYDGHGGSPCAEYLAKHLHVAILKDEYLFKNPTDALREGFLSINEMFFQYMDREDIGDNAGSTSVVALIKDSKLWIAWAGDSEASIYKKNGDCMQISKPHKPWEPKEKERIEQMGGTVEMKGGVWRVCGSLAVSRAFGDARFRQYITADPEIVVLDLKGDEEFLVLACDGLWDVMNTQAVGTFLSQYSGGNKNGMTDCLVQHARSLGSTDNITACVVIF